MIEKPIKITDELLKEHFPIPATGDASKVKLERLFKAVMAEINEVARDALGYAQMCSPIQAVRRLADRFRESEDELAKLREAFRLTAIELHIQKHYAVSGVRWEACEDCARERAMLPEYKVQPNGFPLCECGHSASAHSPCRVSACGCDEYTARK